ncbi:MAG: aryl-alcohol dehydrogenase-like predicted oxidoreductase [Verrucomicrobiales bacterium]|jgi:aryl-alcohol dehydrogenase-like predicted oxidoreductase
MNLTRTAYGTWSGGRFMHFGLPLDEDRYLSAIRHAYDEGIRTFMTADTYGVGEADTMLGKALKDVPRDSYCLVGSIGHDCYDGEREGSKGFPRFTDARLRGPEGYADYVRKATSKSLERIGVDRFDLLFLHNPDSIGFTSEAVWEALDGAKQEGLTDRLGLAPGPANGFTLDVIGCFEKFGSLIDWAMIILNPLEPWPGQLVLPAAEKHGIELITRVVDYGGLFHDDVRPGHPFPERDHRKFRAAGWVEVGVANIDIMRPIAEAHGLSMIQLASLWNLSQSPVKSVIPTMIQEPGESSKSVETKISELAKLPENIRFTDEELASIAEIGNNKGCMALKGGNPQHDGDTQADRWQLTPELEDIGRRWSIKPERDLTMSHA